MGSDADVVAQESPHQSATNGSHEPAQSRDSAGVASLTELALAKHEEGTPIPHQGPSEDRSPSAGTGVSQRSNTHSKGESKGESQGSKKSNVSSALARRRQRQLATLLEPQEFPDPHRYNARSLYLFTLQNPIRRALIRAIEWKWWDRIVLLLIFLNTVQLAAFLPFDVPALNPDPEFRDAMDIVGKVPPALSLSLSLSLSLFSLSPPLPRISFPILIQFYPRMPRLHCPGRAGLVWVHITRHNTPPGLLHKMAGSISIGDHWESPERL